jgi:glucan 1,3-beta-glucosidase
MWLNGFNDNINGYPKVQCDMVPCTEPYMGSDQPGAPPDASKGKQGPFGTGDSTPEHGMCPIDKKFPDDSEVQ